MLPGSVRFPKKDEKYTEREREREREREEKAGKATHNHKQTKFFTSIVSFSKWRKVKDVENAADFGKKRSFQRY